MAGSFAYQKQLVDGEFQPLGVYTNTVDANYVVPADASLIRWNVPAQAAGRSIDFSLIPAGSEVQVEVIDSNVQNVEEVGLVFILNDTAPRVVNIRSVDGAGTVVLSDGTAAEYNVGTSGATIPLLNGNNTHSGTLAVGATSIIPGASFQVQTDTDALFQFKDAQFAGVQGTAFNTSNVANTINRNLYFFASRFGFTVGVELFAITTALRLGPAASSTDFGGKRLGIATMAAGTTGAIADTTITAGSVLNVTFGFLPVGVIYYQKNAGVGFTILSSSALDAGEVSWERTIL